MVPKDEKKPGKVSGIRLGSGAVSARGMAEAQIRQIVELMDVTMMNRAKEEVLKEVQDEVAKLCRVFPVNRSS